MMMLWMMVFLFLSVLTAGEQKSGVDYTRIAASLLLPLHLLEKNGRIING